MNRNSFLVTAAVLILGCISCSPKPVPQTPPTTPLVRVRILSDVSQVRLAFDGAPTVVLGDQRRTLGVAAGQSAVVTRQSGTWTINGVAISPKEGGTLRGGASASGPPGTPSAGATDELIIEQPADGAVKVETNGYRGQFRLVPDTDNSSTFAVINDVDVDSYLKGVLASELFPNWEAEAYKAQAIIARTYALYEVKTGTAGRSWDLYPDERSQVYGGMKAESAKAVAAVNQTSGEVLAYGPVGQERIFKAFFSSCCGGVTASVADAFGESEIPPLRAQNNGDTCRMSTRFDWSPVVVPKAELANRLRAWGVKSSNPIRNLKGLKSVEVESANAFGRPGRFVVTDGDGRQYSLVGEQMRWAINTGVAPGEGVFSSYFKPVNVGDTVRFESGHGFGHGVGACQWCMQARALSGETFQTIALKAFPDAKILRAY